MPSPSEIWAKGNCHDAPDPDIFYPDRDASTYPSVAAEAKKYCHGNGRMLRCGVILECLFYGLVTEDRFGIWGGLSTRERNALRRISDLSRYGLVDDLADTRYYVLIQNYLEQLELENNAPEEEADEGN